MTGRHVMLAVALLGVSGGALAGLETGRTVDAFYTAQREPRARAPEPAYRSPSSWAAENPTFAASPPAGAVWGREVGRDERAFFNPEEGLREAAPVRVHRATVQEVEPPVEQLELVEPLDDWAEPPADPDRLPSAG